MKRNILVVIAFVVMSLFAVSCQEEAKGDAVVGFANASYSLKSSEYLYIPIEVIGETSLYPVVVDLDVEEIEGVQDRDYMITSKHIKISAPSEDELASNTPASASVEIRVPFEVESASRFKLKITSQKNAQKIGLAETEVSIAYDPMLGKWVMTAQDLFENNKVNYNFTVGLDQADERKVWFSNLMNMSEKNAFYGEISEDRSKIYVPLGQQDPSGSYDPNTETSNGPIGGDGKCYFLGLGAGSTIIAAGTMEITYNEAQRTMSFPQAAYMYTYGKQFMPVTAYQFLGANK